MAIRTFETIVFGDGAATVRVLYDDATLRVTGAEWEVVSGTLVGTLTNPQRTRTFTATSAGSLSLPSGQQFPVEQYTNDSGELALRHGTLIVNVRWVP